MSTRCQDLEVVCFGVGCLLLDNKLTMSCHGTAALSSAACNVPQQVFNMHAILVEIDCYECPLTAVLLGRNEHLYR